MSESVPSPGLLPKKYRKRKASDMSGGFFEVKLAALLFLRGVNCMEDFRLASNFKAASSFDDIMFKFKFSNDTSWKCYLIQLKHKTTTNFTIGLSNLLQVEDKSKNNFSLYKYSNSYHYVQARYNEGDEDLLQCGDLDDITFVLYSNAPVHKKLISSKKETSSDEEVLSTSSQGIVIKFDKTTDKRVLTYLKAVTHLRDLLQDSVNGVGDRGGDISELHSKMIEDFKLPLSLNTELTKKIILLQSSVTTPAVQEVLNELNKVNSVKNSDQYECFFNSFLLYASQAHEGELDDLIKDEIKQACFTRNPKDTDLIYKEIRDSILHWWKNDNFFLSKDALFWENIIAERMHSFSKLKINLLHQQFHSMDNWVIEKVKRLIPQTGILNVISDDSSFLTCTKIYLALEGFKGVPFIFVSLETLLEQQDEIIGAWQSKWCNTLVVDCTLTSNQQCDELCVQLHRGIKVHYKSLVLITSRSGVNSLADILKSNNTDYDEFIDMCQWNDFDYYTQLHLLKRDLVFQGHKIPLNQLLNNSVNIEKVLCNGELAQLVERELHVGPLLSLPMKNYISRKLRCSNDELIKIDGDTCVTDRLVVVVAEPGMGKSTLLTFLAYSAKVSDPSKWILRLNLSDCTSSLKELRSNTSNTMKAVEFLIKHSKVSNSQLASSCLKYSLLNTGRVTVFVDGVDEVCPDYKNEMYQLLVGFLNTKIERIWVTSRPVIKDELEEKLRVSSYTLEPFTASDQGAFLMNYWKTKYPDIEDELLMTFVGEILTFVSKMFSEDNPVTSIPQLTSMIAEFYEKDLINFANSNCLSVANLKVVNKVQLYEHFIEAKFIHYSVDKKNQNVANVIARSDEESLKETFLRNHELAALFLIFSQMDLQDLNIQLCEIDIFLNKIKIGAEKTGLIDRLIDGMPHFIHRTFGEHFAGKWFSLNFRCCRNFLKRLLVQPEYEVIKENFDHLLAIDKDLHTSVLDQNLKVVVELLTIESDVNILDKGGRTPLHLAVSVNSHGGQAVKVAIVEKLLDMGASLDAADDVLEWRPLQYADCICDWEVAKLLLQKGGNEDDMTEARNVMHSQVFNELIRFFKDKSAEPVDLMLVAAQYGDLQILKFLIAQGVDVNTSNNDGICAIHKAAESGHLPVILCLSGLGASLTVRDGNNNSLLHFAAMQCDLSVVSFLIDNVGTQEMENDDLTTPLHVAIKNDNVEVFKYLLEKGLSVNAKNRDGWTPLLYAASSGKQDTVKYLIDRGASVNECNNAGWYPLHFMAKANNEDSIKYLVLHGADVNATNNDGSTALIFAAENSNLSTITYLVEQGSKVNVFNTEGWTPLLHVAKNLNAEGIKYLICHGASVNVSNCEGWTPLLYTARVSWLPLVQYLVENGANVNCCNLDGMTPLLFAFKSFWKDTVKYLLDKQASVNVCSKDGMTPLFLASQMKDADLVERLLSMGSSVKFDSKADDATPLHFATYLGNDKLHIVKTLVERGSSINASYIYGTPLHFACNAGNVLAIKYLLSQRPSVDAVDEKGYTPLLQFCKTMSFNGVTYITKPWSPETVIDDRSLKWDECLDVLKCFIECGSCINAANNDNETPLHLALKQSTCLDVVKYLVDHGSCVNAVANSGNTPLLTALQESYDENIISIVKYLVEVGADVNIVNNSGWAPLLCAGHRKLGELIEYFIENNLGLSCLMSPVEEWNEKQLLAAIICAAFKGDSEVLMQIFCARQDNFIKNVSSYHDPLVFAASEGHLDAVKLLYEKDIFSSVENAFDAAVENDHLEIIEYFLMNFGLKLLNRNSPLHIAVNNESVSAVLLLLKYNVDVNACDENNCTALHIAADLGYSDIVNCLLYHGAKSILDFDSKTPLSYAALNGHITCAQLLVESGANVESEASDGLTALHYASCAGTVEIVELLIKHKSSVNTCDHEGNIPLHLAAQEDRLAAVKTLIEHGSDINRANDENSTPLHEASSFGSPDLVQYLLNQGAQITCNDKMSTPLHCAALSGKIHVVRILVEHNADVNAQDCDDCTPLFLACRSGTVDVVKYLIECGANTDLTDSYGDTLLHAAIAGHQLSVIKYLVNEKGYEPVQNNDGETALDIALENNYDRYVDILQNSRKNKPTDHSAEECTN